MADWLYYVVQQTWVAQMTEDGTRAECLEPDGRWVPTREIWQICTHGRQVDGEEEARQQARPPFAMLPGIGIGPFRLGMTEWEGDDLCRAYRLRNEGAFKSGLSIAFENGRATQITFAADMGLSLAGEPLRDTSNRNVRRLLATLAPPGPAWTEMEGLVVFHWEFGDDGVFAFMVYAPGHRISAAFRAAPAGRKEMSLVRRGGPTER